MDKLIKSILDEKLTSARIEFTKNMNEKIIKAISEKKKLVAESLLSEKVFPQMVPFSKRDFEEWRGSKKFGDGSDPLRGSIDILGWPGYKKAKQADIVVSGGGIQIQLDGEAIGFHPGSKIKSQKAGKDLVHKLVPTPSPYSTLLKSGFQEL